eukprot:6897668-Prymnesium_polylepis.1
MSTSKDFETWDLSRHLLLAPDELDDPSRAYLPGVGSSGTELHGGPTYYHPEAELYFMMAEKLDWRSSPSGNLLIELTLNGMCTISIVRDFSS